MVSKDEISYGKKEMILPIGFQVKLPYKDSSKMNIPADIVHALNLKKGDSLYIEIIEHKSKDDIQNSGVDISLKTKKTKVFNNNSVKKI